MFLNQLWRAVKNRRVGSPPFWYIQYFLAFPAHWTPEVGIGCYLSQQLSLSKICDLINNTSNHNRLVFRKEITICEKSTALTAGFSWHVTGRFSCCCGTAEALAPPLNGQRLGEGPMVPSPSERSCVPTALGMGWGEIWDSPLSQQELLNVTANHCTFLGHLVPH